MNVIATPAFLVHEDRLLKQVEAFRGALDRVWPNSVLSYSVKTNALPWVVSWMGRHNVPAEIVSEEEWDLAITVGHDPHRIIVNGPIKTPRLVAEALDAGAVVNVDSRREVRWVLERAKRGDRVDSVGLRVNWCVDRDAPGQTVSGVDGLRFGFHVDNGDLDEVIEELKAGGVRIAGLHLHVTSLTRSLDTYISAGATARRIIDRHDLELDWIDLGGGFFGGDSDKYPSPDEYVQAIRDALTPDIDPQRTTLIIEPGAALIAAAVDFHTSVLDTKVVQDHRIVLTDGSRTNLDTFFRKTGYQYALTSDGAPTPQRQVIAGFTCLDNDRLMELTDVAFLSEGDRIVYRQVGSYSMGFNPLFIQYLPRVYAQLLDSTLLEVRRRWGGDEYLAGNTWG